MDGFEPRLTSTDWGEEWKRLQAAREHYDDPVTWDKRAATFGSKHGPHSDYAERFIARATLREGETVLDMGCGTGALAIPLALAGHSVIAADFSQGMLDKLESQIAEKGAAGIRMLKASWDGDWDAAGLTEDCVDVAFASRSIATNDLAAALAKLTRVARRRACITLPRTSSPRADAGLMRACGIENTVGSDFVYAFNILVSCGFAPEVSYIDTDRHENFANEEEAVEAIFEIARNAARGYLPADELDNLAEKVRPWVHERLVASDYGTLTLDPPRKSVWAFLAWNTRP